MIVTCNNCAKKFDLDLSLIPEKGRLLQCNNCNHKWFFKKEIIDEPVSTVTKIKTVTSINDFDTSNQEPKKIKNSRNMSLLDEQINKDSLPEKVSGNKTSENENTYLNTYSKNNTSKNIKNSNVLGLIIVFIISFVAVIILLDTFQGPIGKIVPNIEFLLYSLYETINDIKLFLKDLI